jgi:hypothetical protein
MRQIFLVSLLLTTTAACGQSEVQTENQPQVGDQVEDTAARAGSTLESVGEEIGAAVNDATEEIAEFAENELSQMNARGFTVRNLIGANVVAQDGGAAATISDLLFDDARTLQAVVIKDGELLGIGGKDVVIAASFLDTSISDAGDMRIVMKLPETALHAEANSLKHEPSVGVGAIDQNELMSINAFMDQPVRNSAGQKVADPFDIVLTPTGAWDDIILSLGGIGALGNRLVEVDQSTLTVNAQTGAVTTTAAAPEFDSLPTFEYR